MVEYNKVTNCESRGADMVDSNGKDYNGCHVELLSDKVRETRLYLTV